MAASAANYPVQGSQITDLARKGCSHTLMLAIRGKRRQSKRVVSSASTYCAREGGSKCDNLLLVISSPLIIAGNQTLRVSEP